MKKTRSVSRKYLLIVLVLLMLMLLSNGKAATIAVGPCEKGLVVCSVSCCPTGAFIPECAAFCIYGYAWCKTYIDPLL